MIESIYSLQFENLSFSYPDSAPIFQQVHFDFPTNDFVWIRSKITGSGRSTLMQILAGLIPVQEGKYLINGQNISSMSFEEFLPWRLKIGYAFDLGGLLHNRTLFENLTLPLIYHKLCTPKDASDQVHQLMDKMNIWRYKDQRPSSVPGGVRKMTCLIRPLLTHPQVLLLDDPSLGLGQDNVMRYMALIHDLRQKGSAQHVFISTFDDQLMSQLDHSEVLIDENCLNLISESTAVQTKLKKVVGL